MSAASRSRASAKLADAHSQPADLRRHAYDTSRPANDFSYLGLSNGGLEPNAAAFSFAIRGIPEKSHTVCLRTDRQPRARTGPRFASEGQVLPNSDRLGYLDANQSAPAEMRDSFFKDSVDESDFSRT
ncbi:hypothetical protein [Bradyrhizobium liaoningense]